MPVRERCSSKAGPNSALNSASSFRALTNHESARTGDRQQAAPFADHECRTKQRQDYSRIDGMSDASVWTRADQFMGMFQFDGGRPVSPQNVTRPHSQTHPESR